MFVITQSNIEEDSGYGLSLINNIPKFFSIKTIDMILELNKMIKISEFNINLNIINETNDIYNLYELIMPRNLITTNKRETKLFKQISYKEAKYFLNSWKRNYLSNKYDFDSLLYLKDNIDLIFKNRLIKEVIV